MNRLSRRLGQNENGSVAVEFAVVLGTILIPLIAATLLFGRFFWHYTVAEKAAHNAARFLASASPTEMQTQCDNPYYDACVVSAARALARKEIRELNPGSTIPQISVECDDQICLVDKKSALPKVVNVYIRMTVEDPFLIPISSMFSGDGSEVAFQINATGRSYYVGN